MRKWLQALLIGVIALGTSDCSATSDQTTATAAAGAADSVAVEIRVGSYPTDVAVSGDGTRLFVVNASSKDLSMIDVAKRSVISQLALGPRAGTVGAIVLSRDGRRAYVGANDAVLLVNVASGSLGRQATTFSLGSGVSSALLLTKDERRLLVTGMAGTITRLDVSNGAFEAGRLPAHLADLVAGPKSLAYASVMSAGDVLVFDTGEDIRLLDRWHVGGAADAMAFDATRSLLYVTDVDFGAVRIVDVTTGQVVESVETGATPKGIALSPGGDIVYVANTGGGSITAFDSTSRKVLGTIKAPNGPRGIAVSPDGNHIFVTNTVGDSVSIIPKAAFSVPMPSAVLPTTPATGSDVFPRGTRTRWTHPKDGQVYVWVPAGRYQMGCSQGDRTCMKEEQPPHDVELSRGFWIGETEVTQRSWKQIMKTSPSRFNGDDLPADNITWVQAHAYCTAVGARLPTEAEWEFAARSGANEPRYGEVGNIAWFSDNSANRTHQVKGKAPNKFGLHDMLGNTWEWTSDFYSTLYFSRSPRLDPKGPESGSWHVLKGGSWGQSEGAQRASTRFSGEHFEGDTVGFRCVGDSPRQ